MGMCQNLTYINVPFWIGGRNNHKSELLWCGPPSQKLVCESHEHPWTSSLVPYYPHLPPSTPKFAKLCLRVVPFRPTQEYMNELRATGLNLDLSDEERQESEKWARVKDGCHKSMCFFCSNSPTKIVGLARIKWRTWPVKKWPLRYLQIHQYNPVNTIWYGSNWINHGGFAWRLR